MPPSGAPSLTTPLRDLVGGRTAAKLAKAQLVTVADLLRHYPRRYSERGKLTDLKDLSAGEPATVWVRVASVDSRRLGGPAHGRRARHLTKVVVTDGTRFLDCALFNQPWLAASLQPGTEVMVSGMVSAFRGTLQMSGPDIATVGGRGADAAAGDADGAMQLIEEFAGGIIPIYPQTAGVGSSVLQQSVRQVLAVLGPIVDPVPSDVVQAREMVDLDAALRNVHRPESRADLDAALARLRYDEALALQLVLARRRAASRRHPAWPCVPVDGGVLAAFDSMLPFELTAGQRAVGEEIARDLAAATPMNRLLQGNVGSGKTVVALRAMLQVIDAGHQAVLLAPTEVLAAQHGRSLRAALGPLAQGGELQAAPGAIRVTVLTGSLKAAAKRQALADIASGAPGIIVGTHALLSDTVMFADLGLVVVDEQHRFGVEQRDALRSRAPRQPADEARTAHVLVMTATPIPRTVAMTVYGDLEVSTLTEAPAGRAEVSTVVVPIVQHPTWVARVWQRIREEVDAGRQAFLVCAKIGDEQDGDSGDGDSGDEDAAPDRDSDEIADVGGRDGAAEPFEPPPFPNTVTELAPFLAAGPLRGLSLATVHGRMPGVEKDAVMRDFAAGAVDVLVATTVIEVGVDVPNAAVMVIVDADRFGISQLHQLRGRIGRGAVPGVCLLVTTAPPGSLGRRRLDAIAATTNGFELAEADLALRREGDVLGTSQSGRRSSLRLLSLREHREVIDQARADAAEWVRRDPALAAHPGLVAMADAIVDEEGQDYLEMG